MVLAHCTSASPCNSLTFTSNFICHITCLSYLLSSVILRLPFSIHFLLIIGHTRRLPHPIFPPLHSPLLHYSLLSHSFSYSFTYLLIFIFLTQYFASCLSASSCHSLPFILRSESLMFFLIALHYTVPSFTPLPVFSLRPPSQHYLAHPAIPFPSSPFIPHAASLIFHLIALDYILFCVDLSFSLPSLFFIYYNALVRFTTLFHSSPFLSFPL